MKWSCASCILCIARVTVHDRANCCDSLQKKLQLHCRGRTHWEPGLRGLVSLSSWKGAHDIVMRAISFCDGVTNVAFVSVMIVTRSTGLSVAASRKLAGTVCRQAVCAGGSAGKPQARSHFAQARWRSWGPLCSATKQHSGARRSADARHAAPPPMAVVVTPGGAAPKLQARRSLSR